jgi:hypothetical protein
MNAKQAFVETGQAQFWENMAESPAFRAAVNCSMLRMLENLEPTEAGAMKLEGAKEFARTLETIHIPFSATERPENRSNLNHKA